MFHLIRVHPTTEIMLKVMSLRLDAGSQPWPPLFNSFVNDTMLQLCPHNDEALLQLLNVPYCCLVAAFLYWIQNSTGLRSDEFAGQRSGPMKLGVSRHSNAMVSFARCAVERGPAVR